MWVATANSWWRVGERVELASRVADEASVVIQKCLGHSSRLRSIVSRSTRHARWLANFWSTTLGSRRTQRRRPLQGGENERVGFAEGELAVHRDQVQESQTEGSIGRGD